MSQNREVAFSSSWVSHGSSQSVSLFWGAAQFDLTANHQLYWDGRGGSKGPCFNGCSVEEDVCYSFTSSARLIMWHLSTKMCCCSPIQTQMIRLQSVLVRHEFRVESELVLSFTAAVAAQLKQAVTQEQRRKFLASCSLPNTGRFIIVTQASETNHRKVVCNRKIFFFVFLLPPTRFKRGDYWWEISPVAARKGHRISGNKCND